MSKKHELIGNPQAGNSPLGVVSGSYYWVKCFKDSEYEPAKAKDRYGKGVMYFCFTDGGVKECNSVVDYKELNYS